MTVDNLPIRNTKKPPHKDARTRARRAALHLIDSDGTVNQDVLIEFQKLVNRLIEVTSYAKGQVDQL